LPDLERSSCGGTAGLIRRPIADLEERLVVLHLKVRLAEPGDQEADAQQCGGGEKLFTPAALTPLISTWSQP
jgi:hypothetical protein